MSRIITFYSYKGGVGRTFALANIAVLLANRGKQVLLMDWDLEAPGLHRYFKPYLEPGVLGKEGLIHLLSKAEASSQLTWQPYVTKVTIPGCEPIDLIPSGDESPDYVERVRSFSWNSFFEKHAGGELLNRWRGEWKADYDFVLVDSRTGITNTGGVCTIYLPDILVLVFSANEQSFERGVQVASGVQKARRDLDTPRPPLAVLPLPGRFDGRDEVDEALSWLKRFAQELKPFYDDWLPRGLNPRQILELTKVPYVTKFSFGEPLPVITQGISDPEFPGFYLENAARLLVSDFQDAQNIVAPESIERVGSIAELRSLLASVPLDEPAIERSLARIENDLADRSRFSELLAEVGVSLLRQQRFGSAEPYLRRSLAMITDPRGPAHPVVRSVMSHLGELLMTTGRLDEAEVLYRQIAETDSESDAPERMATYTNLANVCRQMGRLHESLSWYRRALDFAEMAGRPGDPAVLAAYSNLAGVYREMGRGEEAIVWYERALQMAEMIGSRGEPAVLATYNNLAGVYREMGRRDDAIRWYERALELAEMTGRFGDPAVLSTYNNLAGVYREMGRRDDAIRWYERGLHRAEMTGPPGDRAVLEIYNNLAGVHREMGQRSDAILWYERALLATDTSGHRADPAVLKTYNSLARVYREMGRTDEAIACYERALRAAEAGGRSGQGAALATYNDMAELLRELGRRSDAVRWYQRALEVATRAFGPKSPQTTTQLNNLADILVDEQRGTEAEALLRRALENVHSGSSGDSPIAARIKGNLARVLQKSGRNEEAEEVASNSRFDVFISYASEQMSLVRSLAEKLTERGIRVWFDQWELRPGDSIALSLSDAIASAAAFLLCVGPSRRGGWLEHELVSALRNREHRNQLIIPVLLPGAEPGMVPDALREFHYLDLRDGLTEDGLNRLSSSITRRRKRL